MTKIFVIIDYHRLSISIDNNRRQSISINRLILIIDGQLMTKIFVIIDYHRLSISIDGNRSINIIDRYQICNFNRLPIQSNISIVNCQWSTNKVTHFDIIAVYLSIKTSEYVSREFKIHRNVLRNCV